MSCPQHGYPWPSLATSPYRSPPDIAAVCMFELVVLLLLSHMWGSIGVQTKIYINALLHNTAKYRLQEKDNKVM